MMQKQFLSGVPVKLALIVFTITVAANLPASFIRLALDRIGGNFAYQSVDGRIWNGTINGVQVGEISIGTVTYKWNPIPLLVGNVDLTISSAGGDAIGEGDIQLGVLSQKISIANANVIFDLSAIERYTLYGLPFQGVVRSKIRSLKASKKKCIRADADIWTDAMTASAVKLSGDPLDLVGGAQCVDEKLQVLLNGKSPSGQVSIKASIATDLAYAMAATVTPQRTDLQNSLSLLGFQRNGENYVYDTIGKLKGTGS